MLNHGLVSLEWLSDYTPVLLPLILHTFIDCSFSDWKGKEPRNLLAVILHRNPCFKTVVSQPASWAARKAWGRWINVMNQLGWCKSDPLTRHGSIVLWLASDQREGIALLARGLIWPKAILHTDLVHSLSESSHLCSLSFPLFEIKELEQNIFLGFLLAQTVYGRMTR